MSNALTSPVTILNIYSKGKTYVFFRNLIIDYIQIKTKVIVIQTVEIFFLRMPRKVNIRRHFRTIGKILLLIVRFILYIYSCSLE